ncbi:MAG: phospholipase D family protein [Bdellovibrionales bacterium]
MKPSTQAFVVLLSILLYGLPSYAKSPLVQRAVETLQGGGAEVASSPESVEVAFSPRGGATDLVIKAIASAKSEICVAAYSFTSRPIARALVEAHKAGVDVRVVVDHSQIEKDSPSVIDFLVAQEIPVRADIVHKLQHDKYMVVDKKTVETGSFNYSAAAEHKNSENVIVLWNGPELAALYAKNCQSLWDKAEPYKQQ